MGRALGLLLGFVLDRWLGDPARLHPVAGFGSLAQALERRIYQPSRLRGAVFTSLLVGGACLVGRLLPRGTIGTAVATWTVLGSRTLEREAEAVADLAHDDLPAARARLSGLVGRDTAELDTGGVARAVVESVAENTSDAVVAPLFWGGLLGVPGLLAYRAANTLDAMVGHHTERYAEFGWASARLDDALNWIPARLAATLATVLAPTVGGRPMYAFAVWQRDAHHHPSPNAGPIEAAFAGALGVRLGGINNYAGTAEDRHTLGDGRDPGLADIGRANRLARLVDRAALVVAITLALRPTQRRRARR